MQATESERRGEKKRHGVRKSVPFGSKPVELGGLHSLFTVMRDILEPCLVQSSTDNHKKAGWEHLGSNYWVRGVPLTLSKQAGVRGRGDATHVVRSPFLLPHPSCLAHLRKFII